MRFAITLRSAFIAFAVLALTAAAAGAQGLDAMFAARHVAVEATAESAARARDQAIAEGQRRALEIVLRRLTPAEAHARLPQLDAAEAAQLVDGFQIEQEKASARRYIAELTVEFRPRAVQDLLRGAGIPFVERRAPPLLVLPVTEEGGRLTMFDDPNPWRDAWAKAAAGRAGLVPLLLPLGDLQDVAAVSPEQALAGDDASLTPLARRYGAARWAVAVARPGGDGLDVTLLRPAGSEVETMRVDAGAEPDAAMADAAERLAARFDDEWKREATAMSASAAGGPAARLSATAPFAGFAEWVALRDRVARNPVVRQLDVAAISSRDAQLVLHHYGSPEQLAQALALDDVLLTAGEQGFWRLTLRGSAQAGR